MCVRARTTEANMLLVKRLFVATLAVFVLIMASSEAKDMVDTNCLACLCEASTNCNASATCETPVPDNHLCGAFRISRPYWIDAGKPIIKNDSKAREGAFEECVNDLYCAADTVRKYMINFVEGKMGGNVNPDCNDDGVIDCRDFAFMHRIGGFTCQDPTVVDSEFFKRFMTCWNVVTQAG